MRLLLEPWARAQVTSWCTHRGVPGLSWAGLGAGGGHAGSSKAASGAAGAWATRAGGAVIGRRQRRPGR